MKKYTLFLFVLAGIVLLNPRSSDATGKLFARFPNWDGSPVFDLQLKKFTADVQIQDQLAVVHIDETFFNNNPQVMEGIYILELPEGSKLTDMALWINGERVEQEIKRREDAVQEFEEIVRRSIDPLLAEEIADNVFRLRLFPLPPNDVRRIEITYMHPLPHIGDNIQFLFPLILEDYKAGQVDSAAIHIDIKTQTAIESVSTGLQVPAGKTTINRITDTNYVVEFQDLGTIFDFDFSLNIALASQPVFTALSFTPATVIDDGFLLFWVRPPDVFFPENEDNRDMVFCVDISASMIGPKLSQVKQALRETLDRLTPNDRFNIVAFNTGVESFSETLLQASSVNIDAAKLYVQTLSATGLTNLNGALLSALGMFDDGVGPAQILLIGDGQPTSGVTNKNAILANVQSANNLGVQIFPVAIGRDVDQGLFEELAAQNAGVSFVVEELENIVIRFKTIYDQVVSPTLTEVAIDFGNIFAYDLQPPGLTNLSKGAQLQLAGRYIQPGIGAVSLQADNGTASIDTSATIDLGQVPQTEFVSRFWAAQKIIALQQEIEEFGENQELIDAIVLLSINYSVLSRYTAFLVVEPGNGDVLVSVDEDEVALPQTFTLLQNYPNPFNPETTIKYSIALSDGSGSFVTLAIYNLLGERVRLLVEERKEPGEYTVVWDGRDDQGQVLPSGIYVYKFQVGNFVASRRMLLLK